MTQPVARQKRTACHSQYRIGFGRRGVEICWFSRKLSLSMEEVSSKSMECLASVILNVFNKRKTDKKLTRERSNTRRD